MSGQTSAYSAVPTTDHPMGQVADGEDTLSSQDALLIPLTHTHQQTRGCYPGFAFCKFHPGIVETFIRVSVLVCVSFVASVSVLFMLLRFMLLQVALIGLISLYGARINKTKDEVYDHGVSGSYNWQIGAILVISAASVGSVIEGIMMLLHFLNPSYFNNYYKIFAVMVITY